MKRLFEIVVVLVFALVLAGCGGGGNTGGGGTITFVLNWANHSNPGGGLSAKFDVFDVNGLPAQPSSELLMNQDTNGFQTSLLSGLKQGTYHVTGQLWSQRNEGGVQTGSLDTWLTLSPSASLHVDVGNSVSTVGVTPTSSTFTALGTQQFYALGIDSAQNAVFTPIGSIGWSALGGVATIDASSGLASGSNPGTGSVRATFNPGSIIGGAAITVTPFTPTTSEWTVLVYMNAANDLDQWSTQNMIQMQKVAGVPANVRFVVQWKQALITGQNPTFVATRRYLVSASAGNQMVSELLQDLGSGVDMGDPNTMASFLNWGKANFPANRYCVVVWNHGNGWASGRAKHPQLPTRGFSYDDDTGNHIDTWQLSESLGSVHPDILAWDASLMQMMEVAFEARNQAAYVVGSEESPPASGYPYQTIFANFRDNPTDSTLNLSKTFVDGMIAAYPTTSGYPITQSVLDTSQLPTLATDLSALGDQLIANKAAVSALIPQIRTYARGYSDDASLGRLYRDIDGVCGYLQTGVGGAGPAPSAVQTAAAAVHNDILAAVVYEGHNSGSPGSHGLSIDFSDATSFANKSADYSLLAFGQPQYHWSNWLTVSP